MVASSTGKSPNQPGVWWASFDDGEQVKDVALLLLEGYAHEDQLQSGGIATFLDGTNRTFHFHNSQSGEIVRPGHTIATAAGPGFRGQDEWRVTWIAEVKAPHDAPTVGDYLQSSADKERK